MISYFGLAQIILIDLSLAADNALIVGMAVAALPLRQQRNAMIAGLAAATVLRIIMAFFAVQLLRITGLMVAGGLLLLWVGWKLLREVRHPAGQKNSYIVTAAKTTSASIWQIIIADVSMSLDNVLGVAGVARDNPIELMIGLALSVILMGFAATRIARLTARYPAVIYVGVAIVFYTALRMIYDGAEQAAPVILARV